LEALRYFPKPQDNEFFRFLLKCNSELKLSVIQDLLAKIFCAP